MKLKTYLVCRIIFTFLFMIISTTIWFTRSSTIYHKVESKIQSNEVIISNLKKLSESDNFIYKLKLKNKDTEEEKFKIYIVPSLLSTSISNNYIKYQVNDNRIKTLNMDGMIIVDKLNGLESRDINLKLWISDTYDGILNYDGRIVIS